MTEVSELPFDGYAEAYREEWTDILGRKCSRIVFGKPYANIADAPTRYEYTCHTHKHIGRVKITISETLDIAQDEKGTAQ